MVTIINNGVEALRVGYSPDGPPMSGNIRDEASVRDDERSRQETRYAALSTPEAHIVYDRENHRAWLESDLSLAVDTMR